MVVFDVVEFGRCICCCYVFWWVGVCGMNGCCLWVIM